MKRRLALLVLAAGLVAGSCSGDDDDGGADAATTTRASVFVDASTTTLPTGTSEVVGDGELDPVDLPDGEYDAQLSAIGFGPPYLGFFLVEIRTGAAAEEAWAIDHPDEAWPGDPDFYIFTPDKATQYTAALTDDAEIEPLDPADATKTVTVTLEELLDSPQYLRGCTPAFEGDPVKLSCSPWKVTIVGGKLARAVEQFTP